MQELISANGERHRLYEENNNLDLRLKELSAEYTNRLQQYIHDIAVRGAAFHFPQVFSHYKRLHVTSPLIGCARFARQG